MQFGTTSFATGEFIHIDNVCFKKLEYIPCTFKEFEIVLKNQW